MPPGQASYLLDIFRSVQAIHEYIAGYSREQFLLDPKTQDAVHGLPRVFVEGIQLGAVQRPIDLRGTA